MAKTKQKSTRSPSRFNFSSFVAGIVVGCLASIVVAATAIPILDDYQPDTTAFPKLKETAETYEYEFPTLLGSNETATTGVKAPKPTSDTSTPPRREPQRVEQPQTGYLLQAGSFEERDRADAFRAALMLRGYQAKTTVSQIQNIGTRFRVVIGPYESQSEADAAISRLRDEQVNAIVVGDLDT